jgi:dipeptidyl aminopeptidase/acylaminoacyl peptidase
MPDVQTAAYGSWKSPVTSDLIVSESIRLGQLALDGEDIYWVEQRPREGGRNVIVRRTAAGTIDDVTPPPFNARTRVHEYGGGAFCVADGVVYFVNFDDQRLYRHRCGETPVPVTPEGDIRYADMVIDPVRERLICVQEDHTSSSQEAVNTVSSVPLGGDGATQVLVSRSDFYSSPRLSPDAGKLAWLSWKHPNMPWDGTDLWVSDLAPDGSFEHPEKVAGGIEESIFQPEWSPDGTLYFVSDRTGWWNIYRWRNGTAEAVTALEAEFARPQWAFGSSTYAFQSAQRIICSYVQDGSWQMASLDTEHGVLEPVATPYTDMARGDLRVSSDAAVMIAGSAVEPLSIIRLAFSNGDTQVLRTSCDVSVDPAYLSTPEAIEYPTENGLAAHAFYYPPSNGDYAPTPGEKPPLLVKSHGGPTSATSVSLDLSIQYWTSRGFAVLDVNYGGSTAYGREYRERLKGQWGIVDVDDCVNGALYLVRQGLADGDRLAINGGSAGGYTTLAALTFRDVFAAGASYYGVSDLESLAKDTHKFESRYLDGLVGAYPEEAEVYRQRSPINFTSQLSCPLILFQGLEDKIVPPDQAESMFEAVRAKGIATAYLPFEGEQHGFRRAENIKRALDAELYFYSKIFGFDAAGPLDPVDIVNL